MLQNFFLIHEQKEKCRTPWKDVYATERAAILSIIKSKPKSHGPLLSRYYCEECGGWHVSSMTNKQHKQSALGQILEGHNSKDVKSKNLPCSKRELYEKGIQKTWKKKGRKLCSELVKLCGGCIVNNFRVNARNASLSIVY